MGAVQLIVKVVSPAELAPIIGEPGTLAVHVITHDGEVYVTPVAEFVTLQNKFVVPKTPPPTIVVEELEGVLIVQVFPVVCHE